MESLTDKYPHFNVGNNLTGIHTGKELVAKRYGILVDRKDFNQLKYNHVVNDFVLNFYLGYLNEL